jgi:hypothetical protein
MKSMKNKILSVLIFTFAFFVMHDYVITNPYSEVINHESICMELQNSIEDKQAHIHDSIHSIFSINIEDKYTISEKLSDAKPTNKLFSLISCVTLVPQRPPLV